MSLFSLLQKPLHEAVSLRAAAAFARSIVPFLAVFAGALVNAEATEELTVRTFDLETGDMVYDSSRDSLWMSVRSSAAENADCVISLDPTTMEIEQVIQVGSDPVVLALSDDNRYLYVSLDGVAGYQRIDLTDQTVGPIYGLGSGSSHPYYVADMKAVPGEPEAVAISRRYSWFLGGNQGVAIYENGVARPDQTTLFSPSNSISFGSDPATLFGFNTEGSGRDFYRMEVDESGVRVVDTSRGFPAGTYADGWFVSQDGTVFDPHNLEILAYLGTGDTSSLYSGPGVADRERGKIYRIYNRQLSIYETVTFTPQRTVSIPEVVGTPVQLLRWGDRGLALRTNQNQLMVLEGRLISHDDPKADLRTEILSGPFNAVAGEELTYRIRLSNDGPDTADAVTLTHSLPPGLELREVFVETGEVITSGQNIEVTADSLAVAASIAVTLRATAQAGGRFPLSATASSDTYDPRPAGATNEAVVHIHPLHSPHRVLAERRFKVEHLIAAPDQELLYASIAMEDPLYGNHVLALDPSSGEVVRSFFAGANPTRLAASPDGTYLYSLIRDGRNIARIDLASGEVDLTFALGKQSYDHRNASELLVLPDSPESVVVALRAGGHSAGIAVFDEGVMRPENSPGNRSVSTFTMDTAGERLYGFNGADTGFDFRRFSVDETGVVYLDSTRNLLSGWSNRLVYADGRVYSHTGRVVDPNALAILGSFPPPQTERVSVLPLADANRALFLEEYGLIEAFRMDDFEPMAHWQIPHASNIQAPLVGWSATGFAFAGEESLFFVESTVAMSEKVSLTVGVNNQPVDMRAGMDWTYTVQMRNAGDNTITGLRITQSPASFLSIRNVVTTQGQVSFENNTFEVLAGTLEPGETLDVAVTFRPGLSRAYELQLQIASVEVDEDTSNRHWPLPFVARHAGSILVDLPAEASEGDGVLDGEGAISIGEPEAFDVIVTLAASSPSSLGIPETVTIPAGETTAVFDLAIVDDDLLDETQTVTVAAASDGFMPASAFMQIHDNEVFSIAVALPDSASQGKTALGEVRLDRAVNTEFSIALATDDDDWLILPEGVLIPAGADRVQFEFTVSDTAVPVHGKTVSMRAFAPDGTEGNADILLLPPAPDLPINPSPMPTSHFVSGAPILFWNDTRPMELIVNGRFTTGDFHGWSRESTGGGGWAINDGSYDPPGTVAPQPSLSGEYSAVSYQNGPGTNRLSQEILLPHGAERISLRWSDSIHNSASRYRKDSQEFRVELIGGDGAPAITVFETEPGHPLVTDWQAREVDLATHQEPHLRLEFVQIDSEGYLNVFLDDVSVIAEFPDVTAFEGDLYDVYLGTSPDLGEEDLVQTVDTPGLLLEDLELGTTFYWQVVVRRGGQTVVSPVWSFRTATVDVEITAPVGPTTDEVLEFQVTFTEPVATPLVGEFVLGNAAEASISGEGAEYTVRVVPEHYGDVTVQLPANKVQNGDGEGNAASSVASVFYAGSATFSRWRELYFSEEERNQDPEGTGPDGDPESAGVSNLLRYAFGMRDGEVDRTLMPRASVVNVDGVDSVGIAFHWQLDAVDVKYVIEVSEDLHVWSSGEEVTEVISVEDAGSTQRVVVRARQELGGGDFGFLRLRVREKSSSSP